VLRSPALTQSRKPLAVIVPKLNTKMNYYHGPIHTIYYLVEDNTIVETDYFRIGNNLNNIIATLANTNNQQEIEKLMYDILDEEISFFLKSAHFRERLRVSFRTIIYENSNGSINPNIVEDVIKNWFDTRLSQIERIQFLLENVDNFNEKEINLKIENDFDKILLQESISNQEFINLVSNSFSYFDGFEIVKSDGNMNLLYKLPRTYSELGKILKYNIDGFLLLWFNKHAKRKPTSIKKLKTDINKRLKFIKKDELMDSLVLVQLEENTKVLLKDIEENNSKTAIENVENTIVLLKTTYVETADREFFADFYMEIGIYLNHDFKDELMRFLYSETTSKYLIKKELPWE